MLNIGKMDRRIAIERRTETVSPSGDVMRSWTVLRAAWAEVLQQSASEFFTGYGEAETGTVIFRVRHIDGITTADRVMFDGTAYGIKEVKELGRRDALELRCEATR